jgi:hypothetical protein
MSTELRSTSFGDSTKSTAPTSTYILSKSHVSSPVAFADLTSLTQATDTSNIRLVFAAVKETILQNALKDSGIL